MDVPKVSHQYVGRKIDIIWNVTRVCPWACGGCCVDGVQVTRRGGTITIRSKSLTSVEEIPFGEGTGSEYDQALRHLQRQRSELNLEEKLAVIEHLAGFDVGVNFSGGDVLSVAENLEVLRAASSRLGRKRITLTATGAGLHRIDPKEIGRYIVEFNFTHDSSTASSSDSRPAGYASINLKKAAEFTKLGITTRAECPLTRSNIADTSLRQIYQNLHAAGVDKLLVMRFFFFFLGASHVNDVPTSEQYRRAVEVFRAEEARLGTPKLKLQCALRFLDRQEMQKNPCDLVASSFGLMADGTLLASPWAIAADGTPLDDAFALGNLATTPLAEILQTERAQRFTGRLDENRGHCKIFSFLYSRCADPLDRMFDRADPLCTLQDPEHLVGQGADARRAVPVLVAA